VASQLCIWACAYEHTQTCMHMRDMHLRRRGVTWWFVYVYRASYRYKSNITNFDKTISPWKKRGINKWRISPTMSESWFYATAKFFFSFKNLKIHIVFKTSSLFLKHNSTNSIWFFTTYPLLLFFSLSWVRVYKYFMRLYLYSRK